MNKGTIKAPTGELESVILTPEALRFLSELSQEFDSTRKQLLQARQDRSRELRAGRLYDFLAETAGVRSAEWRVAQIPRDLQDRRVEITGPVERKMIINALNSGANVFMADFEDANSPTLRNAMEGQVNLRDAVRGMIEYTNPDGKHYTVRENPAVLFVRPRGWHLIEKHVLVDGEPISGSLFDFGLYFFHNAAALMEKGSGPYFYLPKMESHLEARVWNDVFNFAQDRVGIPRGTIRATVLIETIPAAFEMDEILFELRDHSAGLNCGRWDYIFSFIKKFSHAPDRVMPDRSKVTMDRHFLKSYVDLLIETCHRRGIHAMGGMAAQIPIKNDEEANNRALDKVRQDKLREVLAGHDGTWVAHPGLVGIAKTIFDEHMKGPNQIERRRPDVHVQSSDLLAVPDGEITAQGLEMNIDIGIQYLESWLRGNGCVPIYNLMEDAATAEISRAQLWQWAHHAARMNDGTVVTVGTVLNAIPKVLARIRKFVGDQRFAAMKFELAAQLFRQMTEAEKFPDFLTVAAYDHID